MTPGAEPPMADLVEAALRRLEADPAATPTYEEIRDSLSAATTDRPLAVAEAAELTGTTAHTLRYYERVGLVRVPRDRSGRRAYDAVALRRVDFVTRMRASGMPIATLQRYVALLDVPGSEPERLEIMRAHRAALARRVAELQLALAITDYKIVTYAGAPAPEDVAAAPTSRTGAAR